MNKLLTLTSFCICFTASLYASELILENGTDPVTEERYGKLAWDYGDSSTKGATVDAREMGGPEEGPYLSLRLYSIYKTGFFSKKIESDLLDFQEGRVSFRFAILNDEGAVKTLRVAFVKDTGVFDELGVNIADLPPADGGNRWRRLEVQLREGKIQEDGATIDGVPIKITLTSDARYDGAFLREVVWKVSKESRTKNIEVGIADMKISHP